LLFPCLPLLTLSLDAQAFDEDLSLPPILMVFLCDVDYECGFPPAGSGSIFSSFRLRSVRRF